jgi:hypothetical protein
MSTIDISRIRSIFEDNIPVKIISEEIFSLPEGAFQTEIKEIMDKENFDIIGAKSTNGTLVGFYHRNDLNGDNPIPKPLTFIHDHIILDSASILTAFKLLNDYEYLFLLEGNKICRLITRSDLDKIPVRLWLFGIISILEMQLKTKIALEFPYEEWQGLLKEKRLQDARKLFNEKKKHNEETELLQCLQLCDLKDIIIKTPSLKLIFSENFSTKKLDHIFKKITEIRNYLAHAQNITTNFTIRELQETSNHIEELFGCLG